MMMYFFWDTRESMSILEDRVLNHRAGNLQNETGQKGEKSLLFQVENEEAKRSSIKKSLKIFFLKISSGEKREELNSSYGFVL